VSLAGAVRLTLSSRIFTSMVSVGAPGMANSSTSLWFSLSAYATVLGATLIRSSGILAPSFYNILFRLFRNFHFDIRDAHSIHQPASFGSRGPLTIQAGAKREYPSQPALLDRYCGLCGFEEVPHSVDQQK